ncbi:GRIP and coiled-coil domain-containing protein 2-like isoform X2 [Argonauta hians]
MSSDTAAATAAAEAPLTSTDAAKSPASTLENLSRDDLLRFIKKQTLLLKKTRSQCESLKKELVNSKSPAPSNNGHPDEHKGEQDRIIRLLEMDKEEMKKSYNSVVAEKEATLLHCQDIEKQLTSLQSELTTFKSKNKEFAEQNECLQLKNETLSESYHCVLQEQEKLVLENKELQEQNNVLTCARDESVRSLKELKAEGAKDLNSQLEALNLENCELEDKLKCAETESQMSKVSADNAARRLEEMSVKMNLLQDSHFIMVDSLNQKEAVYDKLMEKYKNMETDLAEKMNSLEKFQSEKADFIAKLHGEGVIESNRDVELGDIKDILVEYNKQTLKQQSNNEGNMADFKKNLYEMEEKLHEAEDKVLSYSERLVELEENNEKLEKENTSVSEKCENLVTYKVDIETQMTRLKQNFEIVAEELRQAKELAVNCENLQLQLQEKDSAYSSLQQKLTVSAEMVQNLTEKVSTLQSELVNKDCSEDVTNCSTEVNELQNENVRMKTQLEQFSEQKDTLEYIIQELKEQNEADRRVLLEKTEQLKEWENLMNMMKDDKERALVDLEETEQRELHWRNELEFLMNSLHEALNERDSLREEMFKLTEKDCTSIDEINRMKKKVEEIITEKCRLEAELVQLGNGVHKCEVEKENLEREKESLTVVMQLSEEHGKQLAEEIRNVKEFNEELSCAKETLTKNVASLQQELEFLKTKEKEMSESASNVTRLEESLRKSQQENGLLEKEKRGVLDVCKVKEEYIEKIEKSLSEKNSYIQELEMKIIELSNSLSSMKRKYDEMKLENEQSEQVLEEAWVEKSQSQTRWKEGILEKQSIIEDLENTMSKMRAAAAEEMKMVCSDNDHYVVENCALKKSIQQLEEQLNALSEDKIELTNNVEAKHNMNCLLEEKLTLACQQKQVLTEEKEKLIRSIQESSESFEMLSQERQELVELREKVKLVEMNQKNTEQSDCQSKQILEKFEFELQEKDKVLEQLQVELSVVREDNSCIGKENDSLRKDLGERMSHINLLSNQLSDLDQLKDKLHSVETAFETEREQCTKLQSDIEKLTTENKLMSQDYSGKLEQSKDTWNLQVSQLQAEVAEKEKHFNELSTDLNEKIELLKVCEEENENLMKLIDEKNLIVEDLQKVLKEKYDCLSEMESQHRDLCTFKEQLKISSEKELLELRTCLETLEKQNCDNLKTIEQLNCQLSDETKEKLVLKEQLNGKLLTEEEYQRKQNDLENSLTENLSKISLLEESISNFKELLEKKDFVIEEKTAAVTDLENGKDSMKEQLSDYEEQLSKVDGKMTELNEKVSCYEEEIFKLEQSKTELNEKVSCYEEEIFKLEQSKTELNEKVSCYEEEIFKLEQSKTELKEKVSCYEEEIFKLEQSKTEQIARLESVITDLREQTSSTDLEKLLQEKESVLREKSEVIAALEKDKVSMKEHLEESGQLVQEQSELVATLKEELKQESVKSENVYKEQQDNIGQLNGQISQLKDKVSSYEEDIHTIQQCKAEDTARLESTITQLNGKVERLEVDIKAVKEEENLKLVNDIASLDEQVLALKTSLKEKDELNTKLKALAVKSKKQMEQLKGQVDRLNEEKDEMEKKMKNSYEKLCRIENQNIESGILSTNYACLQQEYDKLHDSWEEEKKKCVCVGKELDQRVGELTELKVNYASAVEEKDQLQDRINSLTADNRVLGSSMEELSSKLNLLEKDKDAHRIQKEEILKEKNEVVNKVVLLEKELETLAAEKLNSENKLQQQLVTAKMEASQNSMIDLEIADYERTVKSLQQQLTDKEDKITEFNIDIKHFEERIQTLQKEIDYVDEQKTQAEDRSNKLKQLLMKTKKDLADSKRIESEQKSCEAALRGQLEQLTQDIEGCKLQMSELEVEKHNLEEKVKAAADVHQRSMRTLEKQVQVLQERLTESHTQLHTVNTEYDAYKVRVHSVLKQKKDQMSTNDVNTVESQQREHQDKIIDQLTTKVQELNSNLCVSRQETDSLQEEQDRLLVRHNKLLEDFQERETLFKANLEKLSQQNSSKNFQLNETIQQLTNQNEVLTAQFKDQMSFLKLEHSKTVSALHSQAELNEKEIFRLHRELQQQQQQQQQQQTQVSMATVQFSNKPPDTAESPDFSSEILRHEERQQGEGMEFVDTENLHRGSGVSTLVSFEQLLSQPEHQVVKPPSPFNEDQLKVNYDTAQKRSEHLTQLLSESEATVMQLTEQAKILKQEIRRLERNQEREKESANLEYLKNIFIKFVTLKGGDERQMLIPVLSTMLKLSPEEKTQLTAIAQGDAVSTNSTAAGSWGSYLHRWSGIM